MRQHRADNMNVRAGNINLGEVGGGEDDTGEVGIGIGIDNGQSGASNKGEGAGTSASTATSTAEANNPFKRRPADVIWPSQYIRPDYRRTNNGERTVDRRNRGVYLRMPHIEGLEPEIGGICRPVRLAAGISSPRDPRWLSLTNNKAKRNKFERTDKF